MATVHGSFWIVNLASLLLSCKPLPSREAWVDEEWNITKQFFSIKLKTLKLNRKAFPVEFWNVQRVYRTREFAEKTTYSRLEFVITKMAGKFPPNVFVSLFLLQLQAIVLTPLFAIWSAVRAASSRIFRSTRCFTVHWSLRKRELLVEYGSQLTGIGSSLNNKYFK